MSGGTGEPGAALIRAISLIVPWSRRAEWVEEWRSELQHGLEERLATGSPAYVAAFAMRLRCLGAIRDAIWMRRRHRTPWMVLIDARIALRGVRRRPGFSAAIILTLALGIGAITAIFSVMDPLMVRPLPYPEVHRLVEVHRVHASGASYPSLDVGVWRTLRETLLPDVFEEIEGHAPHWPVVTGAGEAEEVRAQALTPGTLSLLGARAVVGRLFTEADAAVGAPEVVVLGEVYWRRVFGADRGVVGRTIALDGRPFTIIGVLPETFKYPLGIVNMWLPLRDRDPIFRVNGYEALVRLREGVTAEVAQGRIDALGMAVADTHPQRPASGRVLSVEPLDRSLSSSVRSGLRLLAGAVACVLLIACVNAANLLLVRGAGRRTELAVRRSLGATGWRLFRQLLTESLVLALIGGLLGVLLAFGGVRAIVGMMPDVLVRDTQSTISVDARVLAFTVLLSLITGAVFGAGPALRAARESRLASASERTMTASAAVRRAGGTLLVVELALSMMLLVGAGLLLKSFSRLLSVDPGYRAQGLAVLNTNLPRQRYPDADREDLFYAALKERLLALPGVQAVTVSDGVPPNPSGVRSDVTFELEDGATRGTGALRMPYVVVDDDYFEVLGIPIVAGRSFGPADTRTSPASVIIDPDLANLLWPGESPLGRRFRIDAGQRLSVEGEDPWLTVVGVAGDVKLMGPDDRLSPYELYYSSSQQTPWRYRRTAVRGRGDAARLIPEIRSVIRELDPELPIRELAPAEALFGQSLERQRFVLVLMSVFTVVAVVLAAVGVYGVNSYLVAQRTREIGLRIALGATPRSMIGAVLRSGLAPAALGALIGTAAALGLSRFLVSLLYGVKPTDVGTLLVIGALLGAVAIAAALLPAMRAGRVTPLSALRVD